jgi:anaerobic ribonucleoside-triphosphate reductase activating protein
MPNKSIWGYTGYEFDQIKSSPLTKYLDVLVVGHFDISQRDISDNNRFRGSRNQKVLLVNESLTENRPIPLPDIPNNEIDYE